MTGKPEEQSEKVEQGKLSQELEVFASQELANLHQLGEEALEQENAPAWRPDSDEHDHPKLIVGRLVDVSLNITTGEYTAPFVLTTACTTGVVYSVWGWAEALQSQVRKNRPQIGEIIAIRYNGRRTSQKSGREYADYDFRVLRDRPESIDWSQVSLAGGDPPDPFAAPTEPEAKPEEKPEEKKQPAGASTSPGGDDIPFAWIA